MTPNECIISNIAEMFGLHYERFGPNGTSFIFRSDDCRYYVIIQDGKMLIAETLWHVLRYRRCGNRATKRPSFPPKSQKSISLDLADPGFVGHIERWMKKSIQ